MPGLRSVISIVSGICGLKIIPVFFLSLISAMVWNLIWIYAGFTIGDNWEAVQSGISKLLSNYNYTVGTVIVIIILYLTYKFFRKKSVSWLLNSAFQLFLLKFFHGLKQFLNIFPESFHLSSVMYGYFGFEILWIEFCKGMSHKFFITICNVFKVFPVILHIF